MLSVNQYMRGQIFTLSWPVILEMFGVMAAGLLVTAMVGHLGPVSLAAVGLATIVQMSATMVFVAAGTGAAAIVARETGAGNWDTVRSITGQTVMLGFVLGSVLAAFGYCASFFIFRVIDAEPAVAALASDLLTFMFLFTPLYLVMGISNAILRGIGRTKDSFCISTLNNSINLAVSYACIYGVGVPALGAYGAAWGTVIGQSVGGILALIMLARSSLIRLRPADVFTYRPEEVNRILKISVPAALEQVAMQGGRIAFTFMLAGVGTVQFAAHQIANQVESISFLPGFGFSVAAMTLVGQSLGRGVAHRAEQYARLTRTIAFWSMTLMGAVFFFFAESLTGLFIRDPDVLYWGALCVRIAALEQPTIALHYVMGGALRGAGDTKSPMYITATGIWLFRLPLVYLFITVWKYPISTAWWITVGDFLLRSLILWWRFSAGKWKREI